MSKLKEVKFVSKYKSRTGSSQQEITEQEKEDSRKSKKTLIKELNDIRSLIGEAGTFIYRKFYTSINFFLTYYIHINMIFIILQKDIQCN